MIKGIYAIFDRKLNEYSQLVMLSDVESAGFFEHLADDITSSMYRHLDEYDVYQICSFDTEECVFQDFVKVLRGSLKDFADLDRRNLNIITQSLNFLPNGYFRMPKEMQERVEQDIKKYAQEYVDKYMSKDMVKAIGEVIE